MAELTEQDKKNYGKLQEAFAKLDFPPTNTDEGKALETFRKTIKIDEQPKDVEELREKIERLERYRAFSNDLGKPLKFQGNPEEAGKFQQQFLDSLEELKRSIEVIEDEILDLTEGIEKFQPDSLFLEFIPKTDLSQKQLTEDLINDLDPRLNEDQIGQLTKAWGKAVQKFIDDARKQNELDGQVTPGKPETFAHFFRIHKELEVLYSRLADSETVRES